MSANLYTLAEIEIVEVSPRDGLQNEKQLIATSDKIALVEHAIAYGARRIEVTSFVNPRAVPQMGDAEDVCAGLPQNDDVTYIGLVMNKRGADRALATGKIDQLGAVCVTTDTFAMRNQGQTSAGSVDAAREIIRLAQDNGKTAQVTIAASFGCPFEGEVTETNVLAMAASLADVGPVEIALADTIGVANPAHVASLVSKLRAAIGEIPVRVHFHNTRGTGLANVWAAIGAGARSVDTALGGLGGCPFAPGAAGNVSTEDVTYMLERAGISTGLDLDAMLAANSWLGSIMNKPLNSMVGKAGAFPKSTISQKEAI